MPNEPNSVPSLMLEYYEPTFNRMHSTKGADIEAALLGAATVLRSRYFKTYSVGDVLSGPAGHEILRGYLGTIEAEFARVLGKHTVGFWIHLYRRIAPRLHGGHDDKTDATTARLVRDHLECAIAKFGSLRELGDIRRSVGLSATAVLGGRFIRDLTVIIRNRHERDEFVRSVLDNDQFVLVDFEFSDLLAIYRAEGLAYEYWLTTAKLRTVGKGASLVLGPEGWAYKEDQSLRRLIESFDRRIEIGGAFAARIGTLVGSEAETAAKTKKIFAPIYNVGGEQPDWIHEDLGLRSATGRSMVNFVAVLLNATSFLKTHEFLSAQFEQRNGYSMEDFLLAIAALSWRVVMPERQLVNAVGGNTRAWALALLNALRRAYVMVHADPESIQRSIIWYLEHALDCSQEMLRRITPRLPDILEDLTLTEAMQDRIALWTRGPRFPLIPVSQGTLIDSQGMIHLLHNLFVGFRPTHQALQERGLGFEEHLRNELAARGANLLQRWYTFSTGPREIDAAVRKESTLWLVEAHSMERPLEFEIGTPKVIEHRNERFDLKLKSAQSIRSQLEDNPEGENYDVRWAERIEHIVVSPFVEWIWTEDTKLWITTETPRILTPAEFFKTIGLPEVALFT
jgi:hypothetical protein